MGLKASFSNPGGDKKGEKLIGYRVVTQSLLVGTKVYQRGEFINLETAGSELDYSLGLKLVSPVYEAQEPAKETDKQKAPLLKSVPVFWKL